MKTKTQLLVILILMLIGGICLARYGTQRRPSYSDKTRRQQQEFEQDKELRQERDERHASARQEKLDRREAWAKHRGKETNYSRRIKLLEERVAHLEHALTTELSQLGVLPDMQDAFNAETISRSNESTAEIRRAVRTRVLQAIVKRKDAAKPAQQPYRSSSIPWYQGGNLHKATIAQWKNASSQNKLATAADWLTGTKWKGHLTSPADFDRLKSKAQMLANAVDGSTAGLPVDYLLSAEIAVTILALANDLGP